jgi:CHAT domain-containing protein
VALAADDQENAERHFKLASELFSAASQTPVTANHLMEAEIGLARVEIQRKEFSSATHRLLQSQNAIRQISNRYLQVDFFQTLAEAYLSLNRPQEADSALCSALGLTESALTTLQSDNDRLQWDHAAGRTYRTFVESRLQQHDVLGALEFWEWYRASAIPNRHEARAPQAIVTKPSETDVLAGCPIRKPHAVRDQLPLLSKTTVVSYAVLPSGIAAWAYDDRGVQFHWISDDPASTSQLVDRFTTLCSEPTSDGNALSQLGRDLYDQLLAPFNQELTASRPIVFEPDGPLWFVPFSALIRPDGRYLSDISSISEFPGIYYRSLTRSRQDFQRNDAALAVSEDLAVHFQGANLSALPSAATEVQTLAKQFPHTEILQNHQVSFTALSKSLSQATIFHFAGHGIQMPEGAALLILSTAGQSDSPSVIDAPALASLHFSHLRLAVLSACSTETGGDGNGLFDPGSLVRALIKGGVPEVIATRWPVESTATEQAMASFYASLLRGTSAPDALRLAMIKIRTQQSTSHPYYWAAFTSFGWT